MQSLSGVEVQPTSLPTAGRTSNHRLNNFDLIRLVLAASVVFLHAYGISLSPSLKVLAKVANLAIYDWSSGSVSLAVKCFFVVSGYLIFKSYDDSRGLKDFFRKRFLRIYPAYAVVIVATALGCSLLTSLPPGQYFTGPFWKYVVANLALLTPLYPELPCSFLNNPGLKMVNGALWTIKVEVMFYLAVPIIRYCMRRLGLIPIAAAIYALSIIYKSALYPSHLQLANQLPGQLSFFISGALLYYKGEELLDRARWFLAPCLVDFAVEHTLGVEILQPFALAYLVIFSALRLPVPARFRPRWDLSYGVYIIHFPVLEWLISKGAFQANPYVGLLVAGAIVFGLASLSWVFVERPMLRRKSLPAT